VSCGFSAAFQDVAQSFFQSKSEASWFARRRGELRGFAVKNWRTAEATVKIINLDKLSWPI
jgi:hypothetical protein